jgi:two-component system, OmpR family, response regulator
MPHVLVVEDDAGIAAGLRRALGNAGYDVTVAGTGTDAIATVGTGAVLDLVLLDLGLPDADGIDVCRRLVELRPALRVIVVPGPS